LPRCQGYRLRTNRKKLEGPQKPERDQQFRYIQEQRALHQAEEQPCISVDTKKKELVGNLKNAGVIWCKEAEGVEVHNFPSQAVGRAVPYGLYDLQHNCGTVGGYSHLCRG
jgi:Rhodopirellula transposase DDE domain